MDDVESIKAWTESGSEIATQRRTSTSSSTRLVCRGLWTSARPVYLSSIPVLLLKQLSQRAKWLTWSLRQSIIGILAAC